MKENLKIEFIEMIASYMRCVRDEGSDNKHIQMYAEDLVDDMEMLLNAETNKK